MPVPIPSATRDDDDGGEQWVVRGGIATTKNLQNSVAEHAGVPGLAGFSVQSAPGLSVDELAKAGQFRHGQIGVTTVNKLRAVDVNVVKSPGRGFHCTATTPNPLPDALAAAISAVFETRPNTHQVK